MLETESWNAHSPGEERFWPTQIDGGHPHLRPGRLMDIRRSGCQAQRRRVRCRPVDMVAMGGA